MLRGVLFDLDGVLIDSLPSIGACLNFALESLGRPPQQLTALRRRIGPPIEESAAALLGSQDPELVARFVALYRERYAATYLQETRPAGGLAAPPSLFPLKDVLAELAAMTTLAVATSKPEVFARGILIELGVAQFFKLICGRSLALDAEPKAAVIARALAAWGGRSEGLVMVGDRRHDVLGAAAHGIPTIGVLYGMGSAEELREAGAKWLVPDLQALLALLRAIDRGEESFFNF